MNTPPPAPAADTRLTPVQRATLQVVVGMLVPASADGRLPRAADLPQVLQHIERLEAELPALRDGLDLLQGEAIARHGAAFAALDHASRSTLLDALRARLPTLLQRLGLETVTCYYQQDGVIEALGLEARAPYPGGYQILSGDLTLLAPVVARGKTYRDAP